MDQTINNNGYNVITFHDVVIAIEWNNARLAATAKLLNGILHN